MGYEEEHWGRENGIVMSGALKIAEVVEVFLTFWSVVHGSTYITRTGSETCQSFTGSFASLLRQVYPSPSNESSLNVIETASHRFAHLTHTESSTFSTAAVGYTLDLLCES